MGPRGGSRRPSRTAQLILTAAVLLAASNSALGYIGPGAGFAVGGSLLVMFTAFLSALLALVTWPVRWVFRALRGWRAFARSRTKKVIVIGMDGMDPTMADKYLAEGKLPNFARLRDQGCYKRLGTSTPAVSPVAWSTFQTGCNPGKHNIFDFLTRDKRTYAPKLSSVEIRPSARSLRLGKFILPLGKADIRLLRGSKPFWSHLGRHGVFSAVLRVPITFPPEKFRGVQLSGMCVPDLRGTQGMFSFYTTRTGGDTTIEGEEQTGGQRFHVSRNNGCIRSELIGAPNPLRIDGQVLRCPFTVKCRDGDAAELRLNGDKYKLTRGVYTDWVPVVFKAGAGVKVHGICKVLLIESGEEFSLYVTPINLDPASPAMPISHPRVFSTYLAKRQGPFATLGLAEDSWALNEGFIDDEAFIGQCVQYDSEREAMLLDMLDKVRRGLVVCVFDGTDRIQHTFWRELDPDHPANVQTHLPADKTNAIEKLYQRMDAVIGHVLGQIDDDTILMVISDHGFNVFRYGVDLNRWLADNGYLALKAGYPDELAGRKHLTAVHFSKTRAYALGLAGIYLNLKGREAEGIVDPGDEAAELRAEIAEKLSALRDHHRDQSAIKRAYNATKIYRGPYTNEAPDIVVGYQVGYRASWETAIGQVTDRVFHNNVKAWSGDHCIDPSLVPGVLFCNRRIDAQHPHLSDIGPTVLNLFGVDAPDYMDGRPLAVSDAKPTAGPAAVNENDEP